jgi:hypothetical protein
VGAWNPEFAYKRKRLLNCRSFGALESMVDALERRKVISQQWELEVQEPTVGVLEHMNLFRKEQVFLRE